MLVYQSVIPMNSFRTVKKKTKALIDRLHRVAPAPLAARVRICCGRGGTQTSVVALLERI